MCMRVHVLCVCFLMTTYNHENTHDSMAEWLRRQIRNLLGSSRVGSSPAAVERVYIYSFVTSSIFYPPTTTFCSTFLILLLQIYPIIIHLPFCQQLLRILLTSQYPINTSHNHQHSTQHNTTQTKTHTHEPQLTSRQSTNQHTQRTQHIQHRYPFGATTSNDKQSTHVPQQTIHYCHNYGITLSISHIINTTIQLSYSTPIDTHTHQSIITIHNYNPIQTNHNLRHTLTTNNFQQQHTTVFPSMLVCACVIESSHGYLHHNPETDERRHQTDTSDYSTKRNKHHTVEPIHYTINTHSRDHSHATLATHPHILLPFLSQTR